MNNTVIMNENVQHALRAFTRRYLDVWQLETGDLPASAALYGIPSPCVVKNDAERVFWTPHPADDGLDLAGVERALDIQLHPEGTVFYTTQYAGDMDARFEDLDCTLLQSWSAEDHVRMQENQIGHLLTQKRLKLPPTLFLATTDAEMTLISLSNVTGEVWLETYGTRMHRVLAPSLGAFLQQLMPRVK